MKDTGPEYSVFGEDRTSIARCGPSRERDEPKDGPPGPDGPWPNVANVAGAVAAGKRETPE